ncbi:S-type pyocin domain-containing protein [Pseudomonas sp. Bout1]|uniref:S-type pyocin domain-containing protein n=5 Tax=Pseudomonas sp. Bout1 TaxID=3048600 RepID=UPI002AB43095|nr:S-type pyocin domain-containing protein [Pseudomonas sp. Bout1]MDY7530678.1 S-type pyocin domain-containing protein [Pseudomonas sp. Bout1]
MRRYNITDGAKTTAHGVVKAGLDGAEIEGKLIAREGDRVACPTCKSLGVIECIGPRLVQTWEGRQTALDGDLCRCKCSPPPTLIANQSLMYQSLEPAPQPRVAPRSMPPVDSLAPSSFVTPAMTSPPASVCVFAKSCISVPVGSTAAGETPERAANFGAVALMGSTGTGGVVGRVAGTLGADLGAWAVRGLTGAAAGASSALNVVVLAFWPRDIGDSTMYSPEHLANMRVASTRVRFQFRLDEAGDMRVYGLHTRPGSGADRVPVTQARWSADKSAMVAVLDGISITWTPNNGPVVNAPTPYPGTPERLDNLLVHPIPVGQETGITHYPGRDAEDVTWQDTIITFPVDSGVPPLYLVFAKPAVKPLEVGIYGDLRSRSQRDGLDIDHIPSQKVLELSLKEAFPGITDQEIQNYLKQAPAIAIPARVHQKYSETYGGRNTKARQLQDVADLRMAADRNFDAIKRGLLEEGFAEDIIEAAREQLHKLNQEQGWY